MRYFLLLTTYLRLPTSKQERVILLHDFRNFGSWGMVERHTGAHVVEKSAYLVASGGERGKFGVPISPTRACPQ